MSTKNNSLADLKAEIELGKPQTIEERLI